tara:strand:- start:1610 stop:2122 length:513 start_codon:yes stop_codon:yes gene_type:complete
MALGGIAPVLIFTFYREVALPIGFIGPVKPLAIPLVPIPFYLDEKLTGIQLDDYNRSISIDNLREGGESFERVSADVVQLKFTAQKGNIAMTAISALLDRIVKVVEKKTYSITIFYDNIFVLDASLEQFQTSLRDGTDLREISLQLASRPDKAEPAINGILGRAGSAFGL